MERICKDLGHRANGNDCSCHKYVPASEFDKLDAAFKELEKRSMKQQSALNAVQSIIDEKRLRGVFTERGAKTQVWQSKMARRIHSVLSAVVNNGVK